MGDQLKTNPAALPDRALWFVAFICFIDMCGIGIIIPVLPGLISGLTATSMGDAAIIGGWLLFTYAVMQFLFAPVIGGLSDCFGRRPILLVTLFALGLDYLLMAMAPTLAWLFLGRAISGVMGATWAAANSCVADLTTQETRGRAFGILGAGGAAGFVIGPGIGGLLGNYGDRMPFFASAFMALLGALIGYRLLPESLPKERRRRFNWARANPLGTLSQMRKFPLVIGLICCIFLMQLAGQTTNAVWSYFTTLKFGWSTLTIGLSAALFGILIALVQGVLTGPAIARVGAGKAGIFSLAFATPAYLLFAFAPSGWVMFVGIVIGAIGNLSFPAMQALMTEAIPDDAQGELQGAIASAISLTSIIGPPIMAGIFGHFSDPQGLYFPGAPFLLSAGLMALAVLQFSFTITRMRLKS